MGLFKSSNKKTVEPEVSNSEEIIAGPLKRMVYSKLEDDDELALSLINEFKANHPLCVNFSDLNDIANNKMLAFISGAVVAFNGHIIELKSNVYVFVNQQDFLNDEIKNFISEKKE